MPSGAAQQTLKALKGARFTPPAGILGGAELVVVSGFAVTLNPVTGKGPVAQLARPSSAGKTAPATRGEEGSDSFYWIPLETDADCADFVRRVRGETLPVNAGALSVEYRKAFGLE